MDKKQMQKSKKINQYCSKHECHMRWEADIKKIYCPECVIEKLHTLYKIYCQEAK